MIYTMWKYTCGQSVQKGFKLELLDHAGLSCRFFHVCKLTPGDGLAPGVENGGLTPGDC